MYSIIKYRKPDAVIRRPMQASGSNTSVTLVEESTQNPLRYPEDNYCTAVQHQKKIAEAS